MGRNGPAYLNATSIPNVVQANDGPMHNPSAPTVAFATSGYRHRRTADDASRNDGTACALVPLIVLTATIEISIDQNGNDTALLDSASRFAMSFGACRIIASPPARWTALARSRTTTDESRSSDE
jgi:hypothetical protein